MAFDLSKLRKNVQQSQTEESSSSFSKLNLNGLKTQANQTANTSSNALNGLNLSQLTQPKPEPVNPGFSLSFTQGKTYDLDQIMAEKRMDNANAPLFLQANLGKVFEDTMAELVTKKILSDYNIPYSDDNYKTQINEIPNFDRVFTIYSNKYYRIYVGMDTLTYDVKNNDKFDAIISMKYYEIKDGVIQVMAQPLTVQDSDRYKLIGSTVALKNETYEGSISLETVFQQASVTSADVKKYTLEDVYTADKQGRFLSYTDRYRPMIIWTDGTPDPGEEDQGSDKTDVDSDNIAYWVDKILKSNGSISINKNSDGNIYFDIDYAKLAQEYSVGSAAYFKQISEIAAINAELARLKASIEDIASLIGEDVLATNIKISYSKDLYDARPLEKSNNFLNIEIPLDISADDFIYVGDTIYTENNSNGSYVFVMVNPRDYKITTLSNGSLNLQTKTNNVWFESINIDKSYNLILDNYDVETLENGSIGIISDAIQI